MHHFLFVGLVLIFGASCSSDSGPFSSDSDTGMEVDLTNFSMVNQSYSKVASPKQINKAAAVAQSIQVLNNFGFYSADKMTEIDEIANLSTNPQSEEALAMELNEGLQRCQKDTITDRAGSVESISYTFLDSDACLFHISGGFSMVSGAIGSVKSGSKVSAPQRTHIVESFTLTPKSQQNVPIIAKITVSMEILQVTRRNLIRGKTSTIRLSKVLTGTILLNDGTMFPFAMKKAHSNSSTKISDNRSDLSTTSNLKASFMTSEGNVFYENFMQSLPNEEKPKNYRMVNGVIIN